MKGNGTAILQQAFQDAAGKKNCVFAVAPKDLPIFYYPFVPTPNIHLTNGFDFARGFTVKTNAGFDFNIVNYKGDFVKYKDDHDGLDFVMPTGTPVLAVAPGVVLAARIRDVRNHSCPTPTQREVYVLHTVGSGTYREEFVAYYAHLSSIEVAPGAEVARGQRLGLSGNTGCSWGPHLHFGVSRFTNTAAERLRDHTVPETEDYDKNTVIDPYGFSWNAKEGFDPWAWRGLSLGVGALSINLWQPFFAPPRD